MKQTAMIVDFKKEKKLRKTKPVNKDYKMDFSKFRKLLDNIKKE